MVAKPRSLLSARLRGAMLTAQQRISKPSLFGDVAERLKAAVC